MSYCVENDLKLMGFCRGMQMLGVYSGATVMQDIPTYFKEHNLDYHYEHRNEKVGDAYRDYAPHDVSVTSVSSKLYAIAGSSPISNVPLLAPPSVIRRQRNQADDHRNDENGFARHDRSDRTDG
jgi:putative glutamine amidotransferase